MYGLRLLAAALFGSVAAAQVPPPINVLTANYDNDRTNSNLNETILNPSSVNPLTFGKLAAYNLDGSVYAQPLYAAGIPIPGQGVRNVVYAVTMNNSVYAFDADAAGATDPLWQVNLGTPMPAQALNFRDVNGNVGILSTPVIDLERQALYVVSDTFEENSPVFRLHALSLADGHEMLNGPTVIAGTVDGTGAGADDNGKLPFDASQQLQRAGLALANGKVYVAFGSHGDVGNWHGWVFSYDAGDLRTPVAFLNTTPNGYGGSVWQSGRAPAVDDAGTLYIVTGNGDYDNDTNFGESFLALSGSDLSRLSSFTPESWSDWNDHDWDLGSTGALLLPGTRSVLTGGKSGDVFLVSGDAGGGASSLPNSIDSGASMTTVAPVFDVALWNNQDGPILFVFQSWGSLQAYRVVDMQLDSAIVSQTLPAVLTLYAGIAVSADGSQNGTGIVWQTSGNYDLNEIPGSLHAYDAADLSHELWNSDMVGDRDGLGKFAKFAVPTVANGRVYVPTLSNAVVVYGLHPEVNRRGINAPPFHGRPRG